MANKSSFLLENDTGEDFDVYIEPESFVVRLKPGEHVLVTDIYSISPMTVRIGKDKAGRRVLSLWPGDGDVVVEKDGVNVMNGL